MTPRRRSQLCAVGDGGEMVETIGTLSWLGRCGSGFQGSFCAPRRWEDNLFFYGNSASFWLRKCCPSKRKPDRETNMNCFFWRSFCDQLFRYVFWCFFSNMCFWVEFLRIMMRFIGREVEAFRGKRMHAKAKRSGHFLAQLLIFFWKGFFRYGLRGRFGIGAKNV